MSQETKLIAVADPRTFDGDPFEVAARASQQAESLAKLLAHTIEGATLMARNAEMERNLQAGDEPGAAGWDGSAQGKKFARAVLQARDLELTLRALSIAAGYNPRKPPKEKDA